MHLSTYERDAHICDVPYERDVHCHPQPVLRVSLFTPMIVQGVFPTFCFCGCRSFPIFQVTEDFPT